jgi:hypothetical protein
MLSVDSAIDSFPQRWSPKSSHAKALMVKHGFDDKTVEISAGQGDPDYPQKSKPEWLMKIKNTFLEVVEHPQAYRDDRPPMWSFPL